MTNVDLIAPDSATGEVRTRLTQIDAAFGAVPGMFRAVANSPAALASMWGSFGAFGDGVLGAALSEQIAVAVANSNRCEYCLAAHTALGKKAGVSGDAMAQAQLGRSADAKTAALLGFALALVDRRGHVSAADVDALREHGWNDEEIVETVGQVALNIFTNYVNVSLDVPVDFPAVPLR